MKEFYIAPEVEVLCFAPVEALAAESWGMSTWAFGGSDDGTGQVPDSFGDTNIEVTEPGNDNDGE